jgi:hypothetical protein
VTGGTYSSSIHVRALDYWAVRVTGIAVVVLQFLIINDLSLGPAWLVPAVVIAIMIPISIETTLSQRLARRAVSDAEWETVRSDRRRIWWLILALAAIISVANGFALLHLVKALLASTPQNGRSLLLDSLNIWATNVIVFALWYWSLDRGGPAMQALNREAVPEFAFQFSPAPPDAQGAAKTMPAFIDYLFLSFTNSTAFSPTDTLPLSERMKLLMMLQASLSLLTVALVAARAVGILS